MDFELIKEIIAIVGACFCLILFFGLMLLLVYLAISFTMVSNDKEIDYMKSLSEEDKKVINDYKLNKAVRFKDLFCLLKKGKKYNEDK